MSAPFISTPEELTALRLQLKRNNYCPVPVYGAHINVTSAGKRPVMEGWQTHCLNAGEPEITEWADTQRSGTNTGILCGTVVGLDIDVLDPELSELLTASCKLRLGPSSLLRIGRDPKTLFCYRVASPIKKLQTPDLYFGGVVDKQKKAKVEALADGQQFVAFGVHPDTQAPYRWPERSPLDTPASELPLIELETLQSFIEEAEQIIRAAGGETEREIKNNETTQSEAAGSQFHQVRGRIYSAFFNDAPPDYNTFAEALDCIPNDFDYDGWIRIGLSLFDGLGDSGRSLWEGWSARSPKNVPAITAKKWPSFSKASKITFRTLLWEAMRNGWRRGTADQSHPGTGSNSHSSEKTETVWNKPTALPTGLKAVDPFDFEFLPEAIAPWVKDISDRMQCPPDFVGVSAMVALGATLGCRIGVRPQLHTNWIEVPNLWGCIIGRPGAMKSPAMSEALKPLQRLESDARKRNEDAAKEYAAEKEAYEIRKQQAQKKAKAALDKGDDITHMLRLDLPEEPKPRRFIVNDCTYEALGEILSANPNGVLASRDELVSLLKTLDREEQAAARGFFLTAWNGTSGYAFDRIIRGRTYIDRACLSLLGSTQPGKIAEYMRQAISGGASDDGLIQRFGLLVWPDQSPEWKEIDRFPDSAARQSAWQAFERLNDLTPGSVKAETDQYETIPYLRFDEAGHVLFSGWREALERRLRSGSLHPAMESHLSKYRKLVPGLALINHLTDGGVGPISELATLRATSFADYLESHARRAYSAGSEAEAAAAKAILGRIRKRDLTDGFTARDIHQRDWSNLTDRDQVLAGLNLLADCDWIAPESIRTGGRAKTVYRINPEAVR